ncbi:MAG: RagB/SusD family nutrient uptake outer membrane protein [Mediterranea sp.]|jgi:hypothetical protein|nr:RagB/SusD family nutrient uptake outer membrane protein [Mediterranea sp.]
MKKYIIGLVTGLAMITSCADKLDLEPANNITDEQIKEILASGNEAKIDIILGGIANNIMLHINKTVENVMTSDPRKASLFGQNCMRNLAGNDVVFGSTTIGIFGSEIYSFSEDFTAARADDNVCFWNFGWSGVTTANKLLNLLDDTTIGNNVKLKNYKARALVLRAYAYNYLIENYQDAYLQGGNGKLGLMLYDTYDPGQPVKARASSEDTYAFIKKDISQAITLFNEAGIGYTEDVRDFDLGAAYFILARVALCTGDYQTVVSASDNVLGHYPNLISQAYYGGKNTGTEEDPIIFRPDSNAFLNNAKNPEVIYGFPKGEANTTHNTWMNVFGRSYGGESEGFARIDNRLYEKIADNDFRKDAFAGSVNIGNYTYPVSGNVNTIPSYVNLKFAATHALGSDNKSEVGSTSCYYMRSSEILLMKAEAQAQSGNETAAKATLNTLLAARTKAGTPTLTCDNYPSMNGLSALQMVQLQTRIELWGEGGREFYNNKRWNIPVDRNGSSNHVHVSLNSYPGMTLKIPQQEMLYNPLCVQN